MTWFRFWRQSSKGNSETYRWLQKDELDDAEDFETLVKGQVAQWAGDATNWGHEEVKTLPPKVRAEMTEQIKAEILRNSVILDALGKDALKHAPEGEELDALNKEVTLSILQAEELDNHCARAWERVAYIELVLSRATSGVAKAVAKDGWERATAKAKARREHR